MNTPGPKRYGAFADFERDELRPMIKVGFCVDDLELEAAFKHFDDAFVETHAAELDFA